MSKLTALQAQQASQLHSNSNTLTVQQITQALANASVTFAQILYVTAVETAAKHKGENLQKVTSANVILCSNINAHTSVYANKVKKSAASIAGNDQAAVAAFTPQANYFEHTDVHSIVKHKVHAGKFYLYVIYNSANSLYMHNGVVVDKQHVAQYLTPSGLREFNNTDFTLHNKTAGIRHAVRVRTIALSNIVSMTVRKQLLTV
jgi:hypothetical protein